MSSFPFPILFAILSLFIVQTQQKPAVILEVFDYNNDKKVNSTEIGMHYSNIKKKLAAAGVLNLIEKSENGGMGNKDDFLKLTKIAKIDPKVANLVKASDADHNGVLSLKEEEKLHKEYAKTILDRNGDGQVDAQESGAYDAELKAIQFKEFDVNKDSKLDEVELVPFSAKMLLPIQGIVGAVHSSLVSNPLVLAVGKEQIAKLIGVSSKKLVAADVNGDGLLDFQTEYMRKIGDRPNFFAQIFKAAPDLALSKLIGEKLLAKADREGNADGFINYEELMVEATEQMMEKNDLDKDGFLSLKEFQQAPYSAL